MGEMGYMGPMAARTQLPAGPAAILRSGPAAPPRGMEERGGGRGVCSSSRDISRLFNAIASSRGCRGLRPLGRGIGFLAGLGL
jgi:hypothetical protein